MANGDLKKFIQQQRIRLLNLQSAMIEIIQKEITNLGDIEIQTEKKEMAAPMAMVDDTKREPEVIEMEIITKGDPKKEDKAL